MKLIGLLVIAFLIGALFNHYGEPKQVITVEATQAAKSDQSMQTQNNKAKLIPAHTVKTLNMEQQG